MHSRTQYKFSRKASLCTVLNTNPTSLLVFFKISYIKLKLGTLKEEPTLFNGLWFAKRIIHFP